MHDVLLLFADKADKIDIVLSPQVIKKQRLYEKVHSLPISARDSDCIGSNQHIVDSNWSGAKLTCPARPNFINHYISTGYSIFHQRLALCKFHCSHDMGGADSIQVFIPFI